MTPAALLKLTRLNLRRERKSAAFAAFGVAMGVGALVFFVGMGLGVGRVVREQVFPVDASLLDVVPPTVAFGSLLGGGTLDPGTVERLGTLPGVAEVYRKMNVRVPAVSRYEGNFFGSHLRMGLEVLAVGVDATLFEKDLEGAPFTDPGEGKAIPGIASKRLVEIYNKSFAPARKLPYLAPSMLMGFTFPVEFNRSFVAQVAPGPSLNAQVQLAALSDRAPLASIVIPLEAARRINRASGADGETFTGVTLRARDPALLPQLMEEVRRMGLQIDDQERRLAQNTGLAVALTTSALALLSVLICVLAAVNISQTLFASVRARTRELAVMRAVGATRRDIRSLILTEAAATGLGGGLVGTLCALAAGMLTDRLSASFLPPFPFKPEHFFVFPPTLLFGGVVLGIAAALLGAFLPSRQAAAVDPSESLAG